ncbi:ABC transporter ATP-binding protein [Mangrovimonas sp. YM274]|uniref:ABC transporter ATP-binding protein n=1 Tax=Mangrovimonas sp. YM274 TaxID=3070660 RepID=UPI0027DE097A|nr:ABC transporter ATP-binding protein [Mangrovimonas sp. YM274]WMI68461.1 ABC transporter ATP-binding protein [Mangrovimonas sp. YM274]
MKPAIKIENLSKQYRLGTVGTGSFAHDMNRWWHTVRGKEDPYLKIGETNDRTSKGSSDYVWALRDINFEVQQGEVLGIIGKNGAGKSTLLKLLSRVTAPTTGSIKARGRIASLLEVGTGFHPELTGRENVFLNGAIMGMTKQEIASKFDEIVDFAGCERYIDTPVKRYSSGMYVRLAFAVAAHLEPEILIVDEVLAVGDAEFQKKAIGKMQDVSKQGGRTVLFVSHNMASIQNLCSKVVILENGMTVFEGDTEKGIQKYLQQRISNSNVKILDRTDRIGSGFLKFSDVKIKNNGLSDLNLQAGCCAQFDIYFKIQGPIENVIFRLMVIDNEDNLRFVCNNFHSSEPISRIEQSGCVNLLIDNLPLPEGTYYYHLQALINRRVADEIEFAGEFDVEAGDYFKTGKIPGLKGGVYVNHSWKY